MERETYSSLAETRSEPGSEPGLSLCDIFRSTVVTAVTDQADVTLGKVALSTALGLGISRLPSGGLVKDIVRTGLAAGGVTLITDAISNGCKVADALSNSAGHGYIGYEDGKTLKESGAQFALDFLINTGGGITGHVVGRRAFGTRALSQATPTTPKFGIEPNDSHIRIAERPAIAAPAELTHTGNRPEAVYLTGGSGTHAGVKTTDLGVALLPAEVTPIDFGGRAKLLPPAHPFELDTVNLRKLESIARAGTACIFNESPYFSRFTIGGTQERTGTLSGSAFYIGSGRFITNTHTVSTYNYCTDVHLWAPNGKVVPARLERMFENADLAVLKLNHAADAKSFKPIVIGSAKSILKNGENPEVFAFGFPDVNQTSGSRTPQLMVSVGRVDGTANLIKSNNVNGGGPKESFSWFGEQQQGLTDGVITARVTSGFSGGPVLDRNGRLLGVTWGSNVPRQTPTSGEAIANAFAGRTWVAPVTPPPEAQRSYFIPAEFVKHIAGVKQSAGITNFYDLSAEKFKPLDSRLVAFLSKKAAG